MSRKFTSLSVELLEDRLNMAGNVVASLAGNTLTLTGDAAANEFVVKQAGANIMFEGQNGTTFSIGKNGAPTANATLPVNDFTKLTLKIVANGGADRITLGDGNAFTLKKIEIDSGLGADDVTLESLTLTGKDTSSIITGKSEVETDNVIANDFTSKGGLTVKTGGGEDYIDLRAVNVAKSMKLESGTEKDTVYLYGDIGDSLDVKLGEGDDTFSTLGLGTLQARDASFDLGLGNNNLLFHDMVLTTSDLDISAEGNNSLVFNSTVGVDGNLKIKTSDGFDGLSAMFGLTAKNINIDLGNGNSSSWLNSVEAEKKVTFKGGEQTDNLFITSLVGDTVDIKLFGGADRLLPGSVVATSKLSFDVGDGTDELSTGLVFTPKADIKLGNGNDTFQAFNLTITESVTIDGGEGTDTGNRGAGSTLPAKSSKVKFKNFEVGNLAV